MVSTETLVGITGRQTLASTTILPEGLYIAGRSLPTSCRWGGRLGESA